MHGAPYSNFAGKEDLFLILLDERIAADGGELGETGGAAP